MLKLTMFSIFGYSVYSMYLVRVKYVTSRLVLLLHRCNICKNRCLDIPIFPPEHYCLNNLFSSTVHSYLTFISLEVSCKIILIVQVYILEKINVVKIWNKRLLKILCSYLRPKCFGILWHLQCIAVMTTWPHQLLLQ